MNPLPSNYEILISVLGKNRVKLDEPLGKHTYFKLGGPADLFYTAENVDELIGSVQSAINFQVPYFVLGGGSNVIISDKGIRGLVIKNRTGGIKLKGFTGSALKGKLNLKDVLVEVDSGVPSNRLIRFTLDQGLAGLEKMLGLPGSIGGAVYNNSHHLDILIGDYISEVKVIGKDGNIKTYQNKDLKFAYDYSILHDTKEVVLSASFKLEHGDKAALWEVATSAVKRRASTQPLGAPSSGCIFRNIPLSDAMRLGTPDHTTSAGYVIDKAGLKGERVGGAVVSSRHANFIVNDGSATTKDVMDLVSVIKQKVKAKFGVDLTMEVFVVGEN